MIVLQLLDFEEGYRKKPYYCKLGYPTIAIGKRIGPKGADLSLYQFTCSREVAYLWLEDEVNEIIRKLDNFSWFRELNEARRSIIISMAYQLGVAGLFGFKNMIKAIEDGDFDKAEIEALDSIWYKEQTPERAKRHATVLRTGTLKSAYEGTPLWNS